MDAQNVNDTGDVLRYTAGGTAEPYGTDKRGLFFGLRGFNGGDQVFYRDGLQLRGSLFAGFTSLDPYGAERYELLKGPASVLYGQISPGGLLNYVTKRPTEEAFREVELESGYPRAGRRRLRSRRAGLGFRRSAVPPDRARLSRRQPGRDRRRESRLLRAGADLEAG